MRRAAKPSPTTQRVTRKVHGDVSDDYLRGHLAAFPRRWWVTTVRAESAGVVVIESKNRLYDHSR